MSAKDKVIGLPPTGFHIIETRLSSETPSC